MIQNSYEEANKYAIKNTELVDLYDRLTRKLGPLLAVGVFTLMNNKVCRQSAEGEGRITMLVKY